MNTVNIVRKLLQEPRVKASDKEAFETRLAEGEPFTKHGSSPNGVGSPRHINVFFLPYDQAKGQIYLGYHKKADDWIPPGGHIEPGESPSQAVIREFEEELDTVIGEDILEPWNLSVKEIGRPEMGCVTHFDIWYLVHIPVRDFRYDPREYHEAGWFPIVDGIKKIEKNPDFAGILKLLLAV